MAQTPEGRIVEYFKKKCYEAGFDQRKVSYEGHVGAPDRLLFGHGISAWVELKAPHQKPTEVQLREHDRLRHGGMKVFVCDSEQAVDTVFTYLKTRIRDTTLKPAVEYKYAPYSGKLITCCKQEDAALRRERTGE